MSPSVDFGSRFTASRAAIHGVGRVLIPYRLLKTPGSNEARCYMTKRGEKIRAEIFSVLQSAHGAMSAYDVLHRLQASRPKIAPTTVYNGLAALIKSGCVHRVESLKAYIACQADIGHQSSVLSICDECGTIEERAAPRLVENLSGFVEETGFLPQRHVIEVHGLCSSCSSTA